MNRVVLGTVQLGLPYGALAGRPVLPVHAAEAILDFAWSLGIRAFDTAEAYGESAPRLSRWLARGGRLSHASVITKARFDSASFSDRVRAALDRFEGAASRTVLTHGFTPTPEWDAFADVVGSAGAAAGQSVYTAHETSRAIRFRGVARIQAPGNLFEDRARAARGKSDVALDLRSVFLQGVLLLPPDDASRRAAGIGKLAEAVHAAARLAGRDAADLLLASVLRRLGPRDRIVIGVDKPDHLAAIPRALSLDGGDQDQIDAFETEVFCRVSRWVPDALLDPRRWNP